MDNLLEGQDLIEFADGSIVALLKFIDASLRETWVLNVNLNPRFKLWRKTDRQKVRLLVDFLQQL